jgi:uncharacterized protein (UPF0218 family)
MYSPDRWTIFYGQPNDGVVAVTIGEEIRNKATSIFNKVFSI